MNTKNEERKLRMKRLIDRCDFPNTRDGGAWLKRGPDPAREPGAAFDRLCYYADQLTEWGLQDWEIQSMFQDLYWDAVEEYKLRQEREEKP